MFRRNFINLAAFAFSAPAFAQIYGDKSDDYDLIVVGSGAAGLCAAISAFDHGVRKIVVLEKLPILGGTSAISGGAVAVSQTDMQKRMGISDTDEEFFEDLIREGGYRNDPKLVEIYITEVRKQFEWLGNCGIHPSNFENLSEKRVCALGELQLYKQHIQMPLSNPKNLRLMKK